MLRNLTMIKVPNTFPLATKQGWHIEVALVEDFPWMTWLARLICPYIALLWTTVYQRTADLCHLRLADSDSSKSRSHRDEIRCDQAYHFIFVHRCWTSFRIELWMLMIIESLMIGVHLVRSYVGCLVFVDEMHSGVNGYGSCHVLKRVNIISTRINAGSNVNTHNPLNIHELLGKGQQSATRDGRV